ncbi:oxidoreductase- FAD-binding [Apiospora saccharicola]|uniref:Oxidoreductase- FAD-binding n=1 Tax=Apiospora saccharicola TaxID=335842 RepID=A0ABR1UWK1_9PEZI
MTDSNVNSQCQALISLLGTNKVFLPDSAGYNAQLSTYFNPQAAAVQPACFVVPQNAEEVAAVIKSVTPVPADGGELVPFAIRGGGHEWFAGANSEPGGVTIDLRGLHAIALSEDKSHVTVGAGATWDAVYAQLDPLGLSVVGGQIAGVGVTRFEVVLADGSQVVASEDNENADLWWGLRGGSNNLGVVTSMTYRTFEQEGLIWSTLAVHPITEKDNQARVFSRLMDAEHYDVNAYFLTGWNFLGEHKMSVGTSQMVYTRPPDGDGDGEAVIPAFYRPAWDEIAQIEPNMGIPPGVATMSALAHRAVMYRPPQKSRYMSATATFIPTEAMLRGVYDAFHASIEKVADVKGVHWGVCMEPIPPALYNNQTHGGGGAHANALGLGTRTQKTLATFVLSPAWADAADDETVYDAARWLVAEVERIAKELGVYDPFLYLNYAAPWQEVIRSYGEESVKKLQELRKRVDPGQVFTNQVKGGFKIPPSE